MDYQYWIQRPVPIRCPKCKGPAVRERPAPTFDMPWGGASYDEDGRRHTHDPNGPGVLCYCAVGHDFEPATCWCGWCRPTREETP